MKPGSLVGAASRAAREALESLRKQAPGARMIGEMTVRFLSRDAARRFGIGSSKKSPDDGG